jgi:hypothetical protein
MASIYTPNYDLDLYAENDKPDLADQYNAAMGKVDTELKDQSDKIVAVNNNISTINSNVTTLRNNLTTTQGDVSTNSNNISELQTATSGLRTDLTTAQGSIATNTENIGQLQTDTTGLRNDLTTAQGNITTNTNDIKKLNSKFPVSIANGGTGATSAAAARTSLGVNLVNLGVNASANDLNKTAGLSSNAQAQLTDVSNRIGYTSLVENWEISLFTGDEFLPNSSIYTTANGRLYTHNDTLWKFDGQIQFTTASQPTLVVMPGTTYYSLKTNIKMPVTPSKALIYNGLGYAQSIRGTDWMCGVVANGIGTDGYLYLGVNIANGAGPWKNTYNIIIISWYQTVLSLVDLSAPIPPSIPNGANISSSIDLNYPIPVTEE